MAFLVSPGVRVTETDLTNIIPAVSTSIGGFAGKFEWGPTLTPVQVTSEADLLRIFGGPVTSTIAGLNTRSDWYAAANFLGYANNLQVVRVLPNGGRNSVSEPLSFVSGQASIKITGTPVNLTGFAGQTLTIATSGATTEVTLSDASLITGGDPDLNKVARMVYNEIVAAGVSASLDSDGIPGIVDPIVRIESTADTVPTTQQVINGVTFEFFFYSDQISAAEGFASAAALNSVDDFYVEESTLSNGSVYARYPGSLGDGIAVALIDASSSGDSEVIFSSGSNDTRISDLFDGIPGTSAWGEANFDNAIEDEVHVVVFTTNARPTGTAFQVLETYAFLSKAKNAKTADGAGNYYVDVVNAQSNWIYLLTEEDATDGAITIGTGDTLIGSTLTERDAAAFRQFQSRTLAGDPGDNPAGMRIYQLRGGSDGTEVPDGSYTEAYDLLADPDQIDISLLITGSTSTTVKKYVIGIADSRKDCIAFVSPSYEAAVNNPTATKVADYFNNASTGFNSTSYAVFDSGWKRQYDRYNDEYFWAPLNPDIAGLAARTDATNEAWYSPAGLNRGFIRDVVKLSFNPNQAQRDTLYTQRINPVVTLRGQGTLLYGDKTALSRPSAFDRINVRRLFIVLEKAIATAAKFQLFEFNDDLTRRTFTNAVEPFLADVQSRRGMTDFRVVCDESNNTPEVIDSNRFVADIYIKPSRSINFITLNFVAVRTGVSFSEVAGG